MPLNLYGDDWDREETGFRPASASSTLATSSSSRAGWRARTRRARRGPEPARFLLVSTRPPLEVTEEPDLGRVTIYSRHGTLRLRKSE